MVSTEHLTPTDKILTLAASGKYGLAEAVAEAEAAEAEAKELRDLIRDALARGCTVVVAEALLSLVEPLGEQEEEGR
jgi:ArsR family metal-binding transcriptional regulator